MTDQWSRRAVLSVAAGTAAAALAVPRAVRAQERPNVLFVLADDLGYGDLSCYGRPDYDTPVLDRLATQGMKFMSAYAAAPVCTPTRCAFITGRYPQRFEVGLRAADGELAAGRVAGVGSNNRLAHARGGV